MLSFSCSKETTPKLTVTSSKSIDIPKDGGTQTISFKCNQDWSISSSESWVKVSPSSGSARSGVVTSTITVSPNDTYEARSATITVRVADLNEYITISQPMGNGLIAPKKQFDLTNAEQTIEVEVQKNISYNVSIDEAGKNWITQVNSKALTSEKLYFKIAANTSYDNREGHITLKQTDGNLSETITIRQGETYGLFITTPEYDLSNEQHTLSVEVKANVEFDVTSEASWISYVETKGLKTSTITLNVAANEAFDNRTGSVKVVQKNGDLTGVITINQKQTDGLFVTPNSFELTNEEQEIEVEVKKNVSYNIVIPDAAQDWISVKTSANTKALETEKVFLSISANSTYDYREASITFKQVEGTLAETVVITQAGGNWWEDGIVPPDDEIWYITHNKKISYGIYDDSFDQSIISHSYNGGKGIIKLSGSLKVVKRLDNTPITHLFLPNSVEQIKDQAILGGEYEVFHIPSHLNDISGRAFAGCIIRSFMGDSRVQNNGQFVAVDGHIKLIAATRESSLTIPGTYIAIDDYAMWANNPELKELTIEDGITSIGMYAFTGCRELETVHLPNTMTNPTSSVFDYCDKISKFDGPSEYVSSDGKTVYRYVPKDCNGIVEYMKFIMNVAKAGLTDYIFDDDVVGVDPESFCRAKDLQSITFPNSDFYISGDTFDECYNLEHIYGPGASQDGRCLYGKGSAIDCMYENVKLLLFAGKGIKDYKVDSQCKEVGNGVFAYWPLKSIEISDNVYQIGYDAFRSCTSLETVTLPSNLQNIGNDAFCDCNMLKTIYIRAPFPPSLLNFSDNPNASLGIREDLSNLIIYVPEGSVELYKDSSLWGRYSSHIRGMHYDYDYYVSSDYSANGHVTTLQTATEGAGIDLILMGDAFSDRQIADGTYGNVMQKAMNAFFSEEPYKTMKNRFNVYKVDVVSATEGYEHSGQSLSTGRGDGTYCYGNDDKVFDYALNAISSTRMDDATIIVMMNEDAYAGTCFMYFPDSGDYGRGPSIAYFPTSSDTDTFNGLVSHEAGGHGFAKLGDEYAYEYMGAVPSSEVSYVQSMATFGWYKNVDFTSDPTLVKWSHFITDGRYANEHIGCYEGAFTYWTGAWRPTENSIMRYNTGGFNAPSREAIWYRIHKLAYGANWQYNYEDFVTYDAINRTPAAAAKRQEQIRRRAAKPLPPLHAPVVVKHSWREELQKK